MACAHDVNGERAIELYRKNDWNYIKSKHYLKLHQNFVEKLIYALCGGL